jgi:hypothetical protein
MYKIYFMIQGSSSWQSWSGSNDEANAIRMATDAKNSRGWAAVKVEDSSGQTVFSG